MLRNTKLTLAQIALFAMLGAMTFGGKMVMAAFPNIEPVSLLVMLFAVVFGKKGLYPVYVYVLLEILTFGINIWNVYYLYVWAILFFAAYFCRRFRHPVFWAVLAALFGMAFGSLCAIADSFVWGVPYAIAKIGTGLWYDVTHCVGNFVIALVLFVPLRKLLETLYGRMQRIR